MSQLHLILASADTLYLKSFAEYIVSSTNKARFDVKLFSNKSNLERYIQQGARYDILLLEPAFYEVTKLEAGRGMTMFLAEEPIAGQKEDEDTPEIFKYQPLNRLLSDMLAAFYEKRSDYKHLATAAQTKVLSVYSPAGGVGKTTLAINICKQLATAGKKIFYLNMELFNTTSLYFASPEDNPSLQIFYYLKARTNQLLAKIEGLKKYCTELDIYYFDLLPNPTELIESSKEEIEKLIRALAEAGEYDYVVIDLDSSLYEFTKAAFSKSDRLIWLLNNDVQSFCKTKQGLEMQEELFGCDKKLDDFLFIVNRFGGQLSEAQQQYDIPVRAYLPFVPEWTEAVEKNELLHHPVFSKELGAAMAIITEARQEGVLFD
ncbi:Cellulose biosynthesis protein BcsQ [Evansella caseinilytica]|uniref:Cellulose biosynthesis protein BcsQ n=1 Tax=Evansella caseinilytica TaxID=1503961 RepID=A0A1H3QY78_9BACI|nr:AAA family ATPase [Evansella caseinilytica]SDZ18326.1 Cellulose biosynthesis protein BcsQ [Evansella caseinilytica]